MGQQTAAVIDVATLLCMDEDGTVTLVARSSAIESAVLPPQEITVLVTDLISAIDSCRNQLKEATGVDPFRGPEAGKVHSDS